MTILSIPRPNGSAAERETRRALLNWLARRGIRCHTHAFKQYPYIFESVGIWIIASRTLLAIGVWLQWGWGTLLIAILGLLGGTLDVAAHLPLVSWPGARRGENILIEFEPSQADPGSRQEVVLSAHYDSKTELLDHRQRLFFLYNLRTGILLTVLLGLLGPLDRWLLTQGSNWANVTHWIGIILSIPMLYLAWGLGLDLAVGRLLKPSQGAVDNGTACAILLGLAEALKGGASSQNNQPEEAEGINYQDIFKNTHITLALFTGEEVNMQGSRAYARQRDWPLPATALNLEVMGQDGEYVYWEQDGNAFGLVPTTKAVNSAIQTAVKQVTGKSPKPGGPVNSDGASFLAAGIPTGVLGTYDLQFIDRGFHKPTDNRGRVVMRRLPEGVKILQAFLSAYDSNLPAQ